MCLKSCSPTPLVSCVDVGGHHMAAEQLNDHTFWDTFGAPVIVKSPDSIQPILAFLKYFITSTFQILPLFIQSVYGGQLLCRNCDGEFGLNAECPRLQLCLLAPTLEGAEPGLRARWAAGCSPGSRVGQMYRGLQWSCSLTVEAPFILHSKVFGMVSTATQI